MDARIEEIVLEPQGDDYVVREYLSGPEGFLEGAEWTSPAARRLSGTSRSGPAYPPPADSLGLAGPFRSRAAASQAHRLPMRAADARGGWYSRDVLRVAALVVGLVVALWFLWTARAVVCLAFLGVLFGLGACLGGGSGSSAGGCRGGWARS
jgi:hypothetical protein